MGNYEGAKKRAVEKKNYPPGIHGQKGTFSKPSEYGKQLREKQKAKRIYSITEKQFSRYYKLAEKQKGVTGDVLMKMLEMRLDNVVYRSGFAETRRQARQIVSHGLVELNSRRVNIPSISVKVQDTFNIREKRKNSALFTSHEKKKDKSPQWMKVDLKNLSGEIVSEPKPEHFESAIDPALIVEFYSK